jgi:hypothetical protein
MVAPKPPWYQFSLLSLFLLTLFVAVLCSLGVCTHWIVSAVVAFAVTIGGIAGRIVAGTRLGFVQGAAFGIQCFLWAGLFCLFLPFPWQASWQLGVVLGIAVLIGGVVGGFTVRPRSGRWGTTQ